MPTTSTELAAPEPQVLNATPLDLMLSYNAPGPNNTNQAGSQPLSALGTIRAWWLPVARVFVHPSTRESGRPIDGALSFGPTTSEVAITPRVFRSFRGGSPAPVLVTNNTRYHVDVFWISFEGTEQPYIRGLAPGAQWTLDTFEGHFWIARASFTGEVLGMLLVGSQIRTMSITEDFLKQANTRLAPPCPLPEVGEVTLVGALRKEVDPSSRDYLLVSSQDNVRKPRFNARARVPTRTVKISGVKVVWDELLDKVKGYHLMPYQGKDVLDLEALEIYADHLVIASRLHFPGTRVTIHARELEFQGEGQICTAPLAYTSRAESDYKTAKGQPANEKLEPTYDVKHGLEGEPGGAINLLVGKLTVPGGSVGLPRFVTTGSPGQQAEPGGAKNYAPKGTDQPSAAAGKDLVSAAADKIVGSFQNYFKEAKTLNWWRWPSELGSDYILRWDGKQLSLNAGGNIVALRIVACDDTWACQDANFMSFPSGNIQNFINFVLPKGNELAYIPASPARQRPGDGEDAYPGGRPGNGGAGGAIGTLVPLDVALCDTRGGAAGPKTEAVPGEAPGGPNPAYWVDMVIVKKSPPHESDRGPRFQVAEVTAKPGAPAAGIVALDGNVGVISQAAGTWMHPDALDAVVACAKDAYRNGHRDLARSLLEPYHAELRSKEPPPDDLQSHIVAIEAMRNNLGNNVDYYGHGPGWVPRLRLASNFQLFQQIRSISCELLYYALNMEDKYDTLDNANRLAEETSTVVGKELDETVKGLKEAYVQLAVARGALLDVEADVKLKQAQIDGLKTWAAETAVDQARRQRIYRGVMKTIGGMMKACPVGQPYLGLGADMVSAAGEFNWTDPDAIPAQIQNTFKKVGDSTDSFLKDNTDLVTKDLAQPLRDRLQLNKDRKDALDKLIPETKGALKVQEDAVAGAQAAIASDPLQTRKLQLKVVQETLGKLEQELKGEAAINALRKEFADDPEGRGLFDRRKEVLRRVRDLELKVEQQRVADRKHPTPVDPKRAKVLKEAQEALEKTQADLEGQETDLKAATTATAEGTKALAAKEAKVKDALGRLKGMGAGLTAMGQGVSTLASLGTLNTDDEDVKQLAQLILGTEKKEELQKLLKEFEALAKKQRAALDALSRAQQLITAGVAGVAQNLDELNGLSRQRQSVSRALDLRTKRYLKEMQTRARDGLRWSTYNLVMAYRYENLSDVPPSFYDFDKVVDELRKLECTTTDQRGGKAWSLDKAKFKEAEDKVIANEFFGMALKLLNDRQRVASRKKTDFVCLLSPEQLDMLARSGRLVFNLVRDLKKGSFRTADARIFDITDVQLEVKTNDPQLSLGISFRHSGESILLDKDKYYYFRTGPDDDPIAWGFTYNYLVADEKDKHVNKHTVLPEQDEMLNDFLQAKGESKVTFKEYLPAWFSDLTLTLTRGDTWDASVIEKLSKFQFTVSCALRD